MHVAELHESFLQPKLLPSFSQDLKDPVTREHGGWPSCAQISSPVVLPFHHGWAAGSSTLTFTAAPELLQGPPASDFAQARS